jgi:hypothetical protein
MVSNSITLIEGMLMSLSILDQVQTEIEELPPRIIVYGTEGIGKSTFAASAPNPWFIATENGLRRIKTNKVAVAKSIEAVQEQLDALCNDEHNYQSVVIDTLDSMEKLLHKNIAEKSGKKSISDIGFGKGYEAAADLFRDEILAQLDYLNATKNMIVILLAHSKVERFEDPESPAYDRYTLNLHKTLNAAVREWADAVLFATKRTRVEKEDLGFGKVRTIAKGVGADGGERILRTVGGPACVAKNRYDIPGDIPLSWEAFAQYL